MRGQARGLYAIGFALMLAAAMAPGRTEASGGGAVGAVATPLPPPPRPMALVVNSTPHAHSLPAISRRPIFRPARMSYRHVVRPHVITVTAGPAAARRFLPAGQANSNLVFTDRFPRVAAPRGSILLVRGDHVGFVLFP